MAILKGVCRRAHALLRPGSFMLSPRLRWGVAALLLLLPHEQAEGLCLLAALCFWPGADSVQSFELLQELAGE